MRTSNYDARQRQIQTSYGMHGDEVLGWILEHSLMTEDGRLCLFGIKDIAEGLNMSMGTVANCMLGLAGDGYIEKYRCHACYRVLYEGR